MSTTMTEEEWLASTDPAAMGEAVLRKRRTTPRVLRLYMTAFWSWQAPRLETQEERDKLKQRAAWVEEWADTGVTPAEVNERGTFVFYNPNARMGFTSTVRAPGGWKDGTPAKERAVWALHEVFGNPFAIRRKRKNEPRRGWMFDPAWRTDTATTLARQMYDSRDFTAMPILADALEDAGCDNEDVLTHCRASLVSKKPKKGSPQPPPMHVRGCWVVDLVLKNTWAGLA
jgi:hypothetical protein